MKTPAILAGRLPEAFRQDSHAAADIIIRGGLHNTQADPLVAEIAAEAINTAAAGHG